MTAMAPFAAVARPAPAADDDEPGLPNTFISPSGKPFRAAADAPYPVVNWFKEANKKGDGKLDRIEFVADAGRFFDLLDQNKDGVLSHYEVDFYEQRIVPEILGPAVDISSEAGSRARLWLAQVDRPGSIDPGGDALRKMPQRIPGLDESNQGAGPYSFFQEPEPLMAADMDLNGLIRRPNFLKLADTHFTALDGDEEGFLTLAKLPQTPIEKALERSRPRRKKKS